MLLLAGSDATRDKIRTQSRRIANRDGVLHVRRDLSILVVRYLAYNSTLLARSAVRCMNIKRKTALSMGMFSIGADAAVADAAACAVDASDVAGITDAATHTAAKRPVF